MHQNAKAFKQECTIPKVLSHLSIQFETAQSWNPGKGRIPPNNGSEPGGGHPVGPENPGRGKGKGPGKWQ